MPILTKSGTRDLRVWWKMIKISHRGNIDGIEPDTENSPEQIKKALDLGYNVEVDVWKTGDEICLGHDAPEYKVDIGFLRDERLWCHAKNLDALIHMLENNIHCFWHQEDDYTITSKGYIWAYPGKQIGENSIVVLPEKNNYDVPACAVGVCSDYIERFKDGI